MGLAGVVKFVDPQHISIHPPRGGWDRTAPGRLTVILHFNPPTPWGVGLEFETLRAVVDEFQSTHPVGGGTRQGEEGRQVLPISIHPPRGGWDPGPILF